jgi:hypothetical protein
MRRTCAIALCLSVACSSGDPSPDAMEEEAVGVVLQGLEEEESQDFLADLAPWKQQDHTAETIDPCSANPEACCPIDSVPVTLTNGHDKHKVDGDGQCIIALDGRDLVLAHKAADTAVVGGPGKDFVLGGRGPDSLLGGPGKDLLVGRDGPDTIFGNDGDDLVIAGDGNDRIVPGPGRDKVHAGKGDDVVVVNATCELARGEKLDGGPGVDRLVIPVPLEELEARGVKVRSFEEIIVQNGACSSECVQRPPCAPGVACIPGASVDGVACATPPTSTVPGGTPPPEPKPPLTTRLSLVATYDDLAGPLSAHFPFLRTSSSLPLSANASSGSGAGSTPPRERGNGWEWGHTKGKAHHGTSSPQGQPSSASDPSAEPVLAAAAGGFRQYHAYSAGMSALLHLEGDSERPNVARLTLFDRLNADGARLAEHVSMALGFLEGLGATSIAGDLLVFIAPSAGTGIERRNFTGGVNLISVTVNRDYGMATLEATFGSAEFVWQSSFGITRMGPAEGRACFFTQLGGKYEGGGERVEIVNLDGEWIITGQSLQEVQPVAAKARCFPTDSLSAEVSWIQGETPKDLGPAEGQACFLTRVQGDFAGAGEAVRVFQSSAGRWILSGQSLRADPDQFVSGSARCVPATDVSQRFRWTQPTTSTNPDTGETTTDPGSGPLNMGTGVARHCFLTEIQGHLEGLGEIVEVVPSSGNPDSFDWILRGHSEQDGVAGGAVCFTQ